MEEYVSSLNLGPYSILCALAKCQERESVTLSRCLTLLAAVVATAGGVAQVVAAVVVCDAVQSCDGQQTTAGHRVGHSGHNVQQ